MIMMVFFDVIENYQNKFCSIVKGDHFQCSSRTNSKKYRKITTFWIFIKLKKMRIWTPKKKWVIKTMMTIWSIFLLFWSNNHHSKKKSSNKFIEIRFLMDQCSYYVNAGFVLLLQQIIRVLRLFFTSNKDCQKSNTSVKNDFSTCHDLPHYLYTITTNTLLWFFNIISFKSIQWVLISVKF